MLIWATQLGFDDTTIQTKMNHLDQTVHDFATTIASLRGNVLQLTKQMTDAIQDINVLQSQVMTLQKKVDRKVDRSQLQTYRVGVHKIPAKRRKRLAETPYDRVKKERMTLSDVISE